MFLRTPKKQNNMKKLSTLLFLILLSLSLLAGPVDKKTAVKVAENFYSALGAKADNGFDFIYEYDYDGFTSMYFIGNKDKGFVIVSADDNVQPILAYSTESKFIYPIESPEVKWWINGYAKEIKEASKKKSTTTEIKQEWESLLNGSYKVAKATVGPLVLTKWNQTGGSDDYPYNYFCPGETPVGCVATATSQVLRYHSYPATGRGWHTYMHPEYDRLTAVFDTTNYNWNNMPYTSSTRDVALLSYQVGVALDMDYEVSGSGSYTFDLTYILPNYFKYDTAIRYYSRSYIESLNGAQAWIDTLKRQIDLHQPMVYAGYGSSGGHAFVCDGYDDSDNFHFNWGWGGAYDGFFSLNSLTPGSSDFNDGQSAVINIRPAATAIDFMAVKTQSPFVNDDQMSESMRYIDAVDNLVAYAVPGESTGIGVTKDGGATWSFIPLSGYTGYGVSMIYALNKDTLFIPIFDSKGSGNTFLLKSIDGGKTWTKVLEGIQAGTSFFNVVHFFDENNGIVQGDPVNGEFEIYVTSDGGDTWTAIDGANIPDAVSGEYGTVGYIYGNASTVWFFTTKGRVFRSVDKGQTWDVQNLITPSSVGDPDNNDRTSIAGAIRDDGTGFLYELYVKYTSTDTSYLKYYFKTTDNGASWTQYTPTGLDDVNQARILPGTNTIVAVGTGIALSDDLDNWKQLAGFYSNFSIYSADFVSDTYGYLGSRKWSFANGAWIYGMNKAVVPGFTVDKDRSCINKEVEFSDNSLGIIESIEWDFGEDATPATATGPGPHYVTYSSGGEKNVILKVTSADNDLYVYKKTYKVDETIPQAIDYIEGNKTPLLGSTEEYSVPYQDAHFSWTYPNLWSSSNKDTNVINLKIGGSLGVKEISVYPYNGCGEADGATLDVYVVNGITKAYPNPTSTSVYLENTKDASIEIYSPEGKLIDKFVADSYLTILDFTKYGLKGGVYFIRITRPDSDKADISKVIYIAE